jgi:tetratricopeptide (TPR) repeat protein
MTKPRNDTQAPTWTALAEHLRRPWLFHTLLAAVVIVLFSGTLSFGFIWDDHPQIVNNPLIRSWAAIPRVFVSDLWFHTGRAQVYYRPLFVTWSRLNYTLFGLKTWGWHLGAILLHITAASIVYLLGRKLKLDYWTAALAALIFALHPIHIETVAWISAASDTMVTVFCMLAFLAFLNSREPQKGSQSGWWLLSLFLLACGLLTKEMAATFAGVIAVYIWLSAKKQTAFWQRIRISVKTALPYAVVTLAYLALRRLALHNVFNVDSQHGLPQVLLTLPAVLFEYLRLLLAPVGLTGLNYTPYVTELGIRNFCLPVGALIAFVALIRYWARQSGDWVIPFAGLWIIVTLAPVLYLPTFGDGAFVRDRYAYLPSAGFVILMAKAIRLLPPIRGIGAQATQAVATTLLIIAFAAGCVAQQVFWANEVLLYYRGHSLYPEYPEATAGYANQLSRLGDHEKAIALLKQAVRQKPDNGLFYYFLAEACIRGGRMDEGRQVLETALKVLPEHAQAELGMAEVAGLYGRLGDYEHALQLCSQVLQQEPDLYAALYNCGNINFLSGRYGEAEKLLTHAVQVSPDQAPSNYYLGRVLLQDGRESQAERYLQRATELEPNGYDYHYWLGRAVEMRGDVLAAQAEYLRALELNPGSAEAKDRLAAITRAAQ